MVVVVVSIGIGTEVAGAGATTVVVGGGEGTTATHAETTKNALGKKMKGRMGHFLGSMTIGKRIDRSKVPSSSHGNSVTGPLEPAYRLGVQGGTPSEKSIKWRNFRLLRRRKSTAGRWTIEEGVPGEKPIAVSVFRPKAAAEAETHRLNLYGRGEGQPTAKSRKRGDRKR
jgi:hypothetical protein